MNPDDSQDHKADRGDYYGDWTPARERWEKLKGMPARIAERLSVRFHILVAVLGPEVPIARLRRRFYLLCIGMWRGECAVDFTEPLRGRSGRLEILGSGRCGAYRDEVRIWWVRP